MQESPLKDFSLDIDFDRSKDFFDFVTALNMDELICCGLFIRMVQYTARYFPRGTIGVVNKLHLAREIGWKQEDGDISMLLQALYDAGYIDVKVKRKGNCRVRRPDSIKKTVGCGDPTARRSKRPDSTEKVINNIPWDEAEISYKNWLIEQQQVGYRAKNRVRAALAQGYNVNSEDVELIETSGLMTEKIRNTIEDKCPTALRGGRKPKRKAKLSRKTSQKVTDNLTEEKCKDVKNLTEASQEKNVRLERASGISSLQSGPSQSSSILYSPVQTARERTVEDLLITPPGGGVCESQTDGRTDGRTARPTDLRVLNGLTDMDIKAFCEAFDESEKIIWYHVKDLDKKMVKGELDPPRFDTFKAVFGLLEGRYRKKYD